MSVNIDNSRIVRRHRIREFVLPDNTKVARAYNNGQVVDYVLENAEQSELNIFNFLQSVKPKIISIFKYELDVKKAFKCNFSLSVLYVNIIQVTMRFGYKTRNSSILDFEESNEFIDNLFQRLLSDVENRQLHQSGWSLQAIEFLEVRISRHLYLPDEIHDALDQLVPAFERKVPPGSKTPRLVSDFEPKFNYVVSLQHYQLLLHLGVHITKIHQVLRFTQDNYMKKYIDIVSEWRKQSKNEFESFLFKSLMNYVHGKLAQQDSNHKRIILVRDPKKLDKLIRKGNFKDRHIYNYENFSMTMVEMSQTVVKMKRPIIVAAMIWNLSKVYMISYYYFKMRPAFGPSMNLNFFDTDSYCISFVANDYFEPLAKLQDTLDLSFLHPSHPLFSISNKKVLGKFKVENEDKKILAVCCIKSKVYSILFQNDCFNRLKGVQKHFVKNHISFQDYKNCVFNHVKKFALYKSILSKEHILYTVQQSKLALENTDYKRHILPDRIHTLAHFNYRLRKIQDFCSKP